MAEKATTTVDIRDRLVQSQTDNGRKANNKDYQAGVDDGIKATLAEVVEYLDQCIVEHGSAGYVNVLRQMREEFINTNY